MLINEGCNLVIILVFVKGYKKYHKISPKNFKKRIHGKRLRKRKVKKNTMTQYNFDIHK